jgi:sugar lactone lactonase YvrE
MSSLVAGLVAHWPCLALLAENPTWHTDASELAWVDILRPSYNLLDPMTGRHRAWPLPSKIGSATPAPGGGALVALATGLFRLDEAGTLVAQPSPPMAGIHFNDGKCDATGRFWVGTRASDGAGGGGALYRVEPDGAVTSLADGFDVPNGLGWSPDGRIFYLIDTPPRVILRYAVDLVSGTLGRREVLHRFDGTRGKPDGMAVDEAGRLWCAMWDGGGIAILSPEGELLEWLDTPCPRPTSCAFGGSDLSTLFVTSASTGLDPADPAFSRSGDVLAYATTTRGTPVASFGVPLAQSSLLLAP